MTIYRVKKDLKLKRGDTLSKAVNIDEFVEEIDLSFAREYLGLDIDGLSKADIELLLYLKDNDLLNLEHPKIIPTLCKYIAAAKIPYIYSGGGEPRGTYVDYVRLEPGEPTCIVLDHQMYYVDLQRLLEGNLLWRTSIGHDFRNYQPSSLDDGKLLAVVQEYQEKYGKLTVEDIIAQERKNEFN